MKKLFYVMMGALLLWSCSDSSTSTEVEETTPTTTASVVSGLSATSVTFAAEGGSSTVTFNATGTWTAAATESWCTLSATSGEAGSQSLTITAAASTSTDDRNASVTITCGSTKAQVTVTQKYASALTITSSKVEIGADGGEAEIVVKYTDNLTYEIESTAQSWISTSSSRATSTSTLVFTVAANTSKNSRQGQILLTNGTNSETVTVYQEGLDVELVVSTNSYTVASAGETIAVELKSNVDYTVVMPEVTWLTANTSRASSTYTLYYTIAENTTYEQRSAVITYVNSENAVSESVTVTQVQNDAIVVATESYELTNEAQALDFEVNTNVDFTTTISADWITQVSSRGLISKALCFNVAENTGTVNRTATITFAYGSLSQTVTVKQSVSTENQSSAALAEQKEIEREMLVALYKSTNGDSWSTNTNWCSDAEVSTWEGITCDSDGLVTHINLYNHNLTGTLPTDDEMGFSKGWKFQNLQRLYLYYNYITGDFPGWLSNYFDLTNPNLALCYNNMSGSISETLINHESWGDHWTELYYQRASYGPSTALETAKLPAPSTFQFQDIYGNSYDPDSLYSANHYVLFGQYLYTGSASINYCTGVADAYKKYHADGFEIINWNLSTSANATNLTSYLESNEYEWVNFIFNKTSGNYIYSCYTAASWQNPMLFAVHDGYVVWETFTNRSDYENLSSYIKNWMASYYTGSDTEEDSTIDSTEVTVLQLATDTDNNNLNIFLMGDGYTTASHTGTDTYYTQMYAAMDSIFSIPPMDTLRNMFNVYMIRLVCETTTDYIFGIDKSAYSTMDTKAYAYVTAAQDSATYNGQRVPVHKTMPQVSVLYNCTTKIGTSFCNWNTANSYTTFLMRPLNQTNYVIAHESAGHGIGHLVDEYTTGTTLSSSYKSNLQNSTKLALGWFMNCDLNSDAESVKWAYYLSDEAKEKYNDAYVGAEGITIIEGNYCYATGSYRCTETSLMRENNKHYFNAPSREAIWRQIHRMDEGSSSVYGSTYTSDTSCEGFNAFLNYDEVNRASYLKSAGMSTRTSVNAECWDEECCGVNIITRPWNELAEEYLATHTLK